MEAGSFFSAAARVDAQNKHAGYTGEMMLSSAADEKHTRPLAPARQASASLGANANALAVNSGMPSMPYTCQTCARRKVKCDKIAPKCSTCLKGKLDCFYQAPAPRRKRRRSGDENGGGGGSINRGGEVSTNDKLARYEAILAQHGLLPSDGGSPDDAEPMPTKAEMKYATTTSGHWLLSSQPGKLVSAPGKSRYIDSRVWRDLDDDLQHHISDEEDEDENDTTASNLMKDHGPDPLTAALLGAHLDILQCHPTHAQALALWNIHADRVEPLTRILHIPTTTTMVERLSQNPATASKAEECVLFAIYRFAVFAMTEEECLAEIGLDRTSALERYHFAARQALVNASFLKTTEISVIQALVLFLIPCRYTYNPHVYWILTGVAVRISQRIGLHRDGEELGLSAFDLHMRRRLFYQIIPLDGAASQMSGTGMALAVDSWNTKQPLNINDSQIWPGMTGMPEEQNGATDMIFCLARSCIGNCFVKSGHWQTKSPEEIEPLVKEAESEVEEKYIRYCDIVNPVHFLTITLARSAITAIRLRSRLPKVRKGTATHADRREVLQLAQKIMDTDLAACVHGPLKQFKWHIRSFFVWGSWDSIVFVITTIGKPDGLISDAERDAIWNRIEQMYIHHEELMQSRHSLHVAMGRMILKVWGINPPSISKPEPGFIATLRSMRHGRPHMKREGSESQTPGTTTETVTPIDPALTSDSNNVFGSNNISTNFDFSPGTDFNFDSMDWVFWDQLIKDHQAQVG